MDFSDAEVWFTDLWNYSIVPYLLEAVRDEIQVSFSVLIRTLLTYKIRNRVTTPPKIADCSSALRMRARVHYKYDHVTQLLMDLHWLRVPQRIQYKLCVLVHGCLN